MADKYRLPNIYTRKEILCKFFSFFVLGIAEPYVNILLLELEYESTW